MNSSITFIAAFFNFVYQIRQNKLVEEYNKGFVSRYIEYPTPLCNCYLTISSFFPESSNI
ncbi:hypothetical protein BpHYR1_035766 [Brachionus plicatilis]|uniref:Uncharacterized protein n=1 Tax=Brachionus plicatilis TaxID=10195 RepID=A0A3M7Q8X3_BRAPC|nr:hypothetical protein BpHYR1_035766 [Brachionus plicatilis]